MIDLSQNPYFHRNVKSLILLLLRYKHSFNKIIITMNQQYFKSSEQQQQNLPYYSIEDILQFADYFHFQTAINRSNLTIIDTKVNQKKQMQYYAEKRRNLNQMKGERIQNKKEDIKTSVKPKIQYSARKKSQIETQKKNNTQKFVFKNENPTNFKSQQISRDLIEEFSNYTQYKQTTKAVNLQEFIIKPKQNQRSNKTQKSNNNPKPKLQKYQISHKSFKKQSLPQNISQIEGKSNQKKVVQSIFLYENRENNDKSKSKSKLKSIKQSNLYPKSIKINSYISNKSPSILHPTVNEVSHFKQVQSPNPNKMIKIKVKKQQQYPEQYSGKSDLKILQSYEYDEKQIDQFNMNNKPIQSYHLQSNKTISIHLDSNKQDSKQINTQKEPINNDPLSIDKVKSKTPRKKIFIKQQPKVQSNEFGSENLTNFSDEQMKMLLGAKGNKYKEAIILTFIRENRKQYKN